jgi:hypothetical protein
MPKNRKILLLERPDSGPAFAELLRQQGFDVRFCSSVSEAIQTFDEMLIGGEEPWLIITGALTNVNAGVPASLPLIEHCARANFTGRIVGMSSIPTFLKQMRAVGADHLCADKSLLVAFVRDLWVAQNTLHV